MNKTNGHQDQDRLRHVLTIAVLVLALLTQVLDVLNGVIAVLVTITATAG
jgi:hypothetical protein